MGVSAGNRVGLMWALGLAAGCGASPLSSPIGMDASIDRSASIDAHPSIDTGRPTQTTATIDAGAIDAGSDSVAPGFPSGVCTPPGGLRLLAPLSGSTVTAPQPRLRLVPGFTDDVDVQVCRDRACTQVFWEQVVAGAEVTPDVLPTGYWFWRARSVGPTDGGWTSAWEFRVRHRSPAYAPQVNTAAEPFNDFNGDGYPDVMVGEEIIFGGASGVPVVEAVAPTDSFLTLPFPTFTPPGDLNGDGFTDFASLYRTMDFEPIGLIQLGSPQGLQASTSQVDLFPGHYPLEVDETPVGVGDVDGDGYGDMVWSRRYGGYLIRGCAGGTAPGPWAFLSSEETAGRSTLAGDVNGDGLWDIVYIADQYANVYLGTTGTPRGVSAGHALPGALMADLNGDGYSDLYTMEGTEPPKVFFGGPGGLTATGGNADLPIQIDGFGDFDGDGYLDLVSWTIGNVRYGGVSPFAPSAHSAAVPIALGGAVADLNADGFDDLLLSVDGTSWELLLGSADGLAADPIAVPAP
jgi:hypothetical protein